MLNQLTDFAGRLQGGIHQSADHANCRDYVDCPPLSVQRRIAGILSAYDDLIENNQRRIKILEEMARSLYREWFVNFRFPGHEKLSRVASTLGDIPQGWEVRTVEEIVKRIPGDRDEDGRKNQSTRRALFRFSTKVSPRHHRLPRRRAWN